MWFIFVTTSCSLNHKDWCQLNVLGAAGNTLSKHMLLEVKGKFDYWPSGVRILSKMFILCMDTFLQKKSSYNTSSSCNVQQREAREFTEFMVLLKRKCIFLVKLDSKKQKKILLWLSKLLLTWKTGNYYQGTSESQETDSDTSAACGCSILCLSGTYSLVQEISDIDEAPEYMWRIFHPHGISKPYGSRSRALVWKLYEGLSPRYSVETPSTTTTLVRQRKTVTCVCWYHMAGDVTQASRQMVMQINYSGQVASEKEGSPFKGQEASRNQEPKSCTNI